MAAKAADDDGMLDDDDKPQQAYVEDEEKHDVLAPAADSDVDVDDSHKYSHLKSTLKKSQRAWVDPWEAAVQDTFYHKQIENLRPTFEVVNSTIKGVESLRNIFDASVPASIAEEDNRDIELEEEEKAMAEPKEAQKF